MLQSVETPSEAVPQDLEADMAVPGDSHLSSRKMSRSDQVSDSPIKGGKNVRSWILFADRGVTDGAPSHGCPPRPLELRRLRRRSREIVPDLRWFCRIRPSEVRKWGEIAGCEVGPNSVVV